MNKRWLEIVVCPICQGKLVYDAKQQALICRFDRVAFPIEDGIPALLASAARPLPEASTPAP